MAFESRRRIARFPCRALLVTHLLTLLRVLYQPLALGRRRVVDPQSPPSSGFDTTW
jgi:hypothetical protein